jgi:tRNA-splicing ligase RtcB
MAPGRYWVRGRGCAESFESCAHGAGRRMSRTQAERQFSTGDLECQTEGVICRTDRGVLDEIPGAYKDIDQVMANQAELVEAVHTLKQLVCVKG